MVNYWSFIKQVLLPAHCLLCNTSLPAQQSNLCEECTLSLPWLTKACARCALPLTGKFSDLSLCGNCQQKPPPFTQCHTLFHYQYPVDKLITQLKFQHKLVHASTLAELMAQHMCAQYQHQDFPNLVLPVPLHKRRLRERGFNQAQEIARQCAALLGLPITTDLCWRHKHTDHQPGLSAKERRRNLQNAFHCKPFPEGTRVVLVDDVMTTGTTLNELSLCLKRAGCEEVHLWCIARAHPA